MKNIKFSTFISFALSIFITANLLSCNQTQKETTEEEVVQDSISQEETPAQFGGLALYTVREQMNESVKQTLQAVVDAGYANIEAAGYSEGKFYNMNPADFKALLDSLGLDPVSTHQGTVTFENIDQQIIDVKAAGFEYFVIPVPPMGLFTFNQETRTLGMTGDAKNLTDIISKLAEKCHAAGLQLLYHNHDFEFKKDEQGNAIIDYLLENTDPEKVNFQMDLYWVTKAGADPVAYIEKYPGRFKSWHVKDMDDEGRFAPVGNGHIDFKRILDQQELSGLEYYYVEQDMTFNETPLEAIKISHEGLKNIGFK